MAMAEKSAEKREVAAKELDTSRMTEEFMWEMVDSMKCRGCNWIPKPDRRFVCGAGHHYCSLCGNDLKEKEGVCGTQVSRKQYRKIKKKALRNPKTPVEVVETLTKAMPTKETGYFCPHKLTEIGPDPLYLALFNNLEIQCPVSEFAPPHCSSVVSGAELDSHKTECMMSLAAKVGISLTKAGDNSLVLENESSQ